MHSYEKLKKNWNPKFSMDEVYELGSLEMKYYLKKMKIWWKSDGIWWLESSPIKSLKTLSFSLYRVCVFAYERNNPIVLI